MRRAWVIAIVLCIGACGGTPNAVEVPRRDVPFDLARSGSPGTSDETVHAIPLYFVEGGRLFPVLRNVDALEPLPAAALRALLAGPSDREQRLSITTAIPSTARSLGVSVSNGVATVDMSGEFEDPAPSDEVRLRVAQVVWTLCHEANIHAVTFMIDGSPISVVTGRGTPAAHPVQPADYQEVAPVP